MGLTLYTPLFCLSLITMSFPLTRFFNPWAEPGSAIRSPQLYNFRRIRFSGTYSCYGHKMRKSNRYTRINKQTPRESRSWFWHDSFIICFRNKQWDSLLRFSSLDSCTGIYEEAGFAIISSKKIISLFEEAYEVNARFSLVSGRQ